MNTPKSSTLQEGTSLLSKLHTCDATLLICRHQVEIGAPQGFVESLIVGQVVVGS